MFELLKRGAPPNNDYYTREHDGWTPLHTACYNNHHHSAELLIKYGAIVAGLTNSNSTSLHWACVNNNRTSAELLLKHGCPKGEPECQSNYMVVRHPYQGHSQGGCSWCYSTTTHFRLKEETLSRSIN